MMDPETREAIRQAVIKGVADDISLRSKLEALEVDLDEEEIFGPREERDPALFSVGDRLALSEWLESQERGRLTAEQKAHLADLDRFIESLDLKKNGAREGPVALTSPTGVSWIR